VTLRRIAACSAALIAAACAQPTPAPPPAPEPVSVPVANSDMCYLVQAEVAKQPSLDVDRVPDVVKYDPKPLLPPKGGYPRNVIRRDGTTKVKVSVVVDTAGKADMSTFTVLETTHPWLADNIKALVPKWTFTPAYKNGCRVAGLWIFTAAPGQPPQRTPAARKPATPSAVRKPVK
jgi:hypothetical protein